jgi:hypothetical protein
LPSVLLHFERQQTSLPNMLHLHRGNDLSENATEWNKKTNENVVQSTSVNATEAVDYDTIR